VHPPDKITDQNEKMWDARAKTYDRYFGFARWTQKKLVSFIKLENNPYLLDMACGTGWAVRYAANFMKGRGEFYGIDNSSKMIEQAKAISANYKNINFQKANVEGLPFENDFFGYIVCSNAFHHFSNPDRVVKETYRVLKPGGKIYILDVTADNFFIRLVDRLGKLEHEVVPIVRTARGLN
jgi:ubiquinone/menaquinone biosynthesis C-methylase UbiE